MTVSSYILCLFVAYVCYLVYYRYVNVYLSIVTKPEKRYDYIIVGAGTTGCVLASRLSEDPEVKVLLIEAGDHMSYFTKIPMTPTVAQHGPNDWSVTTVAQKYSSFGMWGQSQMIPRGKGLGGSGQINFLLHSFGLPEDYDRWSNLGFRSWTMEYLKPYFIRAFGTVRNEFDSEHCSVKRFCPGSKAPMKLKLIDEENELLNVFKRASNMISDKRTIFRKPTATIKDGARVSTLDVYLKPALNRRNLHVLLRTQAISIRFENLTASSVYILKNNIELDNIFVNREIILSAGAIKTPQLLMMSGIGPRDLIQRLRIKLVSENNDVGKNLHDHMNMPIFVSIKKPISVTLSKIFNAKTIWDYFWYKSGLLSFPPVAGLEYHNSSALMLFAMGTTSERLLRDLSNYKPKVFRDTFPFYKDMSKEGFMFLATCVQPKSRGTVTLKDSSISVQPAVDPNYLHQHWDVKCMIRAIRRAERLIASRPFQDIGARIHWPRPERCLSFWRYSKEEYTGSAHNRQRKLKLPYVQYLNQTNPFKKRKPSKNSPPDEYLDCIIREIAVTGHHIGGTCAGGVVVDDHLRVKSVSKLRIMDASVIPSPISLYPNSVLIAMAEKAADIIHKYVN